LLALGLQIAAPLLHHQESRVEREVDCLHAAASAVGAVGGTSVSAAEPCHDPRHHRHSSHACSLCRVLQQSRSSALSSSPRAPQAQLALGHGSATIAVSLAESNHRGAAPRAPPLFV
jgi:hypothetical protein